MSSQPPVLSRSVRGLRVLVTGAASGMGRATAELFAVEGAHVAACDINEAGVQETAARIMTSGGVAHAWRIDLADGEAIPELAREAAQRLGGLDILINNAGVGAFRAIDAADYETQWDRLHAVLLLAQARMIRAALPWLRQSNCPRIVNIASTEALGATARDSIYAAFKAGVTGLTRALAVELGPEGITVNCICPGPILTGMTAGIPDADRETYARRRTALRRYGTPEEVAHMTLSLCLPAASYITGAVIPVDGGLMARNA
jgi:3-oxoacyl-[acyl-carrier protein] reductase